MTALATWLAQQAAERESNGLARQLTSRESWDPLVDLAGNDYLGLARHPRVVAATAAAARQWGAGSTASRLVTGTLGLHAELEADLAAWCGQQRALVFSSGYLANLGAVAALADAETLIVSDAHVHASLVDGCRLARGRVRVVPHNDVSEMSAALASRPQPRALVVVESVYSVLGDVAPLPELAELCERYDATLLVDEAHALGVAGPQGRGLTASLPRRRLVVTATLSKALGAQGGAVLGPAAVVDHLTNAARTFVFDTALAPPAAAAAGAALAVLRTSPELVQDVRDCAAELAAAVGLPPPAGAVLSVPMPNPEAALRARAEAEAGGVRVGAFRPPSVPDGLSRLRITARAGLSPPGRSRAAAVLADVCSPAASPPR